MDVAIRKSPLKLLHDSFNHEIEKVRGVVPSAHRVWHTEGSGHVATRCISDGQLRAVTETAFTRAGYLTSFLPSQPWYVEGEIKDSHGTLIGQFTIINGTHQGQWFSLDIALV